jgi:hypothetical protein
MLAGDRLRRLHRTTQALLVLFPQEAQGQVQVFGFDPRDALTRQRALHALLHHRHAMFGVVLQQHREKQTHHNSSSRSITSAACDARHFTSLRLPMKRCSATRVPPGDATAIYTKPTGFSGVPPVGPAMPVVPMP